MTKTAIAKPRPQSQAAAVRCFLQKQLMVLVLLKLHLSTSRPARPYLTTWGHLIGSSWLNQKGTTMESSRFTWTL